MIMMIWEGWEGSGNWELGLGLVWKIFLKVIYVNCQQIDLLNNKA
jgi:hypothetical protein